MAVGSKSTLPTAVVVAAAAAEEVCFHVIQPSCFATHSKYQQDTEEEVEEAVRFPITLPARFLTHSQHYRIRRRRRLQ